MGWLLALAERIDDHEQLTSLVFALPDQTTILREQAAELTRKLAAYFLGKAQASNDFFAIVSAATLLNNLANRLRDLGRREDALTAAEEAVEHYRALAEARPEAFSVDLARSLWVLGDLYGETKKPDLAVNILAEAILHLTPAFLQVPQVVVGMMSGIGQSYLSHCEAVRREPDLKLLRPVLALFEKFKQQEEKE